MTEGPTPVETNEALRQGISFDRLRSYAPGASTSFLWEIGKNPNLPSSIRDEFIGKGDINFMFGYVQNPQADPEVLVKISNLTIQNWDKLQPPLVLDWIFQGLIENTHTPKEVITRLFDAGAQAEFEFPFNILSHLIESPRFNIEDQGVAERILAFCEDPSHLHFVKRVIAPTLMKRQDAPEALRTRISALAAQKITRRKRAAPQG